MKKIIKLMVLSLVCLSGCKEEGFQSTSQDSAPGKITVTKIENGPGKARIHFNLPDSESLLYIEGEYEDKGKQRSVKVSNFNTSLDLEGFSEAKPYSVTLYSVSRGLNKSEPVQVTVDPERPPYLVTAEGMTPDIDFGGFNLNFENPAQASLATFIEKWETMHEEWTPLDAFYSQEAAQQLIIRNQVGENLKYRLRVRDKFENYSAWQEFVVTPWVEVEMNYDLFKGHKLPGDPFLFQDGTMVQPHEFLWNQVYAVGSSTSSGAWVGTSSAVASPINVITFDMGKVAKVTRMTIFQRGMNGLGSVAPYSSHNLTEFEIWGSNAPDPDGSWESWDLMLTGNIVKPAGTTADLLDLAKRGNEFNFERSVPAYRYIRLKQKKTFASAANARFFLAGIKLFENLNY